MKDNQNPQNPNRDQSSKNQPQQPNREQQQKIPGREDQQRK